MFVRDARFCWQEKVFIHEASLQPFPQDGFVQGDMRDQPVVRQAIKAGPDVALEDPLGRCSL